MYSQRQSEWVPKFRFVDFSSYFTRQLATLITHDDYLQDVKAAARIVGVMCTQRQNWSGKVRQVCGACILSNLKLTAHYL